MIRLLDESDKSALETKIEEANAKVDKNKDFSSEYNTKYTKNILNTVNLNNDKFVSSYYGVHDSAGWRYTDFIKVEYGDRIVIGSSNGKNLCGFVCYALDYTIIKEVFSSNDEKGSIVDKFIDDERIQFIRCNIVPDSILPLDQNYLIIEKMAANMDNISKYTQKIEDMFKYDQIINALDSCTYINDYVINEQGTLTKNQYTENQWKCTDFIPVEENDKVYLSYVRGMNLCGGALYDANKQFIKTIWGTEDWEKPSTDNNGKFEFYVDSKTKFIRYNIMQKDYPVYVRIRKNAYIKDNISKYTQKNIFYVGNYSVNSNFSTLKECCDYIQSNSIFNATVYVDYGTYDLVQEFGESYLDSINSTTNKGFGLMVGNNTHFIFAEGAKIVFNYSGTNEKCAEHFSAFNVYGSVILENANIEVSNARYCVHEDLGTVLSGSSLPMQYTSKYINCNMKHKGNNIGSYTGTVCIGAGTLRNSLAIIDGGTYECGTSYPWAISYHNFYKSSFGDYPSKVVLKNVWINNGFRCGVFGDSNVDVEISGCYIPKGINGKNSEYFNVKEWNNVIE